MKKLLIIAACISISIVVLSCKSDCNCPGGGGYKKKLSSIEQPKTDFQLEIS